MAKFTKEQIEEWLGTSPLIEAIDVITDVANGEYKLSSLKSDIEEYFINQ